VHQRCRDCGVGEVPGGQYDATPERTGLFGNVFCILDVCAVG
jgi:hypothetical protein